MINAPAAGTGVPARTELSDRISKDLKKRGFRFVGTTILYAYLQAVGVVNDHSRDCFHPCIGLAEGGSVRPFSVAESATAPLR